VQSLADSPPLDLRRNLGQPLFRIESTVQPHAARCVCRVKRQQDAPRKRQIAKSDPTIQQISFDLIEPTGRRRFNQNIYGSSKLIPENGAFSGLSPQNSHSSCPQVPSSHSRQTSQ
jgi:hypothetical protein